MWHVGDFLYLGCAAYPFKKRTSTVYCWCRRICIKLLWVMLTPIRANTAIVTVLPGKVMVKLNPRLSESLWIWNKNGYSCDESCENPSVCQNYCTTCPSVSSWLTVMRVICVGHVSDILSHKVVPILRKSLEIAKLCVLVEHFEYGGFRPLREVFVSDA